MGKKTDSFSKLTSLSVWLALGMTSSLVMSRVSLLWLLRLFKYEQIHPATWYLVLFFILTVPHVMTLLHCLWDTPLLSPANRKSLPKAYNVVIGALASLLEGVATAAFATEVPQFLPEPVLLTLPFTSLAFTLVYDLLSRARKSPSELSKSSKDQSYCGAGKCPIVLAIVIIGVFYFWCPAILSTVLYTSSPFNIGISTSVVLVSSTILLSCIWWPVVQKMTLLSNTCQERCQAVDLIYVPIKIASVILTLFLSLLFKLEDFRRDKSRYVSIGFREATDFRIWLPIVFCLLGGFSSLMVSLAATKSRLITAGIKIPMFLCPWIVILTTAVLWNDLETEAFWELTGSDAYTLSAIGLAGITWFIPFCVPKFRGFRQPFAENRPVMESVHNFSWNSFFLEPMMILNYEWKSVNKHASKLFINKQSVPQKLRTLFICTTMYKESEIEMKRYISSIKNVFANNDDSKLQIEAHVFFDSAVSNFTVNARGRHLLKLLCEDFSLNVEFIEMVATPYGCRASTGKLLNYPIYIHFKDPSKVKAKKRWSQVMYLHYILQYRTYVFQKVSNQTYFIKSGSLQSLPNSKPTHPGHILHCNGHATPAHYQKLNVTSDTRIYGLQNGVHSTSCTVENDTLSNGRAKKMDGSETEESFRHSGLYQNGLGTHHLGGLTTTKSSMRGNPELGDVYLLSTDADTEFSIRSVRRVLSQCESNSSLGAVCGRTVPVGSPFKPVVWYQKFEYAKDFWLVKSSQNVIGSVTCCPGCFSIYRGSALFAVAKEFSQSPTSAFQSLLMDHGEDRWLCTLLMKQGWRLGYCSNSYNSTHCPETVGEFLRQRRRWVLSEISNMAAIISAIPVLVRRNSAFSVAFLVSLVATFLWVLLSPATTLVFLSAGLEVLYDVSMVITLPITAALFLGYCAVCCVCNQSKQKLASFLMTIALSGVVIVLAVGFVLYVAHVMNRDLSEYGIVQFRPYFLVFLMMLAVVYAGMLHPKESLSLLYGLIYCALCPAMYCILPVYALANMIDTSWGTREAGSHGCCQKPISEEDEQTYLDYNVQVDQLEDLQTVTGTKEETDFWEYLKANYIGNSTNTGGTDHELSKELRRLRRTSMIAFVAANILWFTSLSCVYITAGSDAICYGVAAAFSFCLIIQLFGLTCYKWNGVLSRYLKMEIS